MARENEELKQKISNNNHETLNIYKMENNSYINNSNLTFSNDKENSNKMFEHFNKNKDQNNITKKINDHFDDLNPDFKISEINSHRISVEYLKNVLLKYLEAIAIGNEFQTKILENVIFSILKIANDEKIKLEDKRNRSSFYLNLWYNAKAYLSAKIYGNSNDLENFDTSNNLESLKFEMDKNLMDVIQSKNHNLSTNKEKNIDNLIDKKFEDDRLNEEDLDYAI